MKGARNSHIDAFETTKKQPSENIIAWLEGWVGDMMGKGDKRQHNGCLVLTDQRVSFFRKGFFGEVFETIPIASVTSIETRSVLGYRAIAIHTSHDELRFKTFEPADYFKALHDELETRRGKGGAVLASGTALTAPAADAIDKLARLAELCDRGVLTTEEFDAQKKRLLAEV